jgi:hypothetical protein
MSAYLVSTPKNPAFDGKVYGIQFSNGRAVVSKETLNPNLGYSLEQVIQGFQRDFKYEVQPIGVEAAAIPAAEKPAETVDPGAGRGGKGKGR